MLVETANPVHSLADNQRMREAEFAVAEFETPAESADGYREGWQRLKDTLQPSKMADMR
jgi:hypothetical protein